MFLQWANARDVKVARSVRFRCCSVALRNLHWTAQNSPERVSATMSMPSSTRGRLRQIKVGRNALGHLVEQPDVPELGPILGSSLEVELCQALEGSTSLRAAVQLVQGAPKVIPATGLCDQPVASDPGARVRVHRWECLIGLHS